MTANECKRCGEPSDVLISMMEYHTLLQCCPVCVKELEIHELQEERAAIMQYDGKLPKDQAEAESEAYYNGLQHETKRTSPRN